MHLFALLRCAVAPCAALVPLAIVAVLVAEARAEPPDRYPLAADLESFEAPSTPIASVEFEPEPDEPTGALVLADALALALLRNPELAVDSYEQRAREAALLQAGVRPNPTLSLGVEDIGGTGDRQGLSDAQTTLILSQVVELGGKRAARVSLARADVEVAAWDYEIRRIEVFSNVSDAFVEVLASQERLILAEDALAIAREVENVASRRTRAGMASPAEELRARVSVDISSTLREHTHHELQAARQALAAHWAGTPRFTRALGDLMEVPQPPSPDDLTRRIEASPNVARWQAEVARREAMRKLARSSRTPNLELSGGPRHLAASGGEKGDMSLVAGVSVPLPFWDRRAGAIAEAEQRFAQLAAQRKSDLVRIRTSIQAAQLKLVAAVEEAKLLREQVLPGIEQAVQILQRGYEEGRFAQVEVLEAERARVDARQQALSALVEAHHSAREIERLTGVPLEVRQ